MKKDGAFFITRNLTRHQALAFSMDGRRRKFLFSRNGNNGLFYHLGFF